MKLFSRKGLLAVATASAVAAGSLSTPAFAETEGQSGNITVVETTVTKVLPTTTVTEVDSANVPSSGIKDDEGYLDPEEITKWVAVVSTIVTVLGTVVTFLSKIPGLFK